MQCLIILMCSDISDYYTIVKMLSKMNSIKYSKQRSKILHFQQERDQEQYSPLRPFLNQSYYKLHAKLMRPFYLIIRQTIKNKS